MPDLVLFPPKKFARVDVKRLYSCVCLSLFALFIVGGNLLRIVPVKGFPNHFSIVEFFLYLFAVPLFFSKLRKSQLVVGFVALSAFYGILLHGWVEMSILYSLKLMGMVMAGVAVGESLHGAFGKNRNRALQFVIWVFGACVAGGFTLYFLFPNSVLLYEFLENYGIVFEGDPHVRRFLSPFLDPNFFCAIVAIPLILTLSIEKKSSFFFLFLGAALLTWSRSGIATIACILFLEGLGRLSRIGKTPLKELTYFALLIVLGAGFIFAKRDAFFSFAGRLFHFAEDPSSIERVINAQFAFPFFWESPFFGMGYNFLSPFYSVDSPLFAPDSSLFFAFLTFGILPTFCLAGALTFWLVRLWSRTKWRGLLFRFTCYLVICIFFTSQFNNLLFYQYFLVPILALFTYMERCKQ